MATIVDDPPDCVPGHLVHILRRLYESGSASVRLDNVTSQAFYPSAGVCQGYILSPLLFNIYTQHIMRISWMIGRTAYLLAAMLMTPLWLLQARKFTLPTLCWLLCNSYFI